MQAKRQNAVQQLALSRIVRLFSLAKDEFKTNPKHSHDWIRLACRIATRNRVRIPDEYKTSYCKKCHCYLFEGKTKQTTTAENWLEIKCLNCGHAFKRKKTSGQKE